MEFHNRKACVDYYDAQFPHLPRYMIEMAFDLDQTQSKKKMTGSERRALKHVQPPKKEEKKEGFSFTSTFTHSAIQHSTFSKYELFK